MIRRLLLVGLLLALGSIAPQAQLLITGAGSASGSGGGGGGGCNGTINLSTGCAQPMLGGA